MDHLLTIYQDYSTAINLTLALVPWDKIQAMLQVLHQARVQQRTVFVIGSGLSASTASHLAHELDRLPPTSEMPQFRVIALTDATPAFALWGEDRAYDNLFPRLIMRLQPGDVVIATAPQTAPPEVLHALRRARASDAFTIALGSDQDTRLSETVNLPVLIPSVSPDQIEDIHQIIVHIVVKVLHEYKEHTNWKERWRVVAQRNCRQCRLRPFIFRPDARHRR